MANCIFCKIVNKEIPSFKIFENDKFFAFLDINPRNEGHSLVVTKKHFRWVWDVPYLGEYFEVTGKIANSLRKAMNTDWIVSVIIGEEVPHAHVHLIPRYLQDGHGGAINFSLTKKMPEEKMAELAKKISSLILS